MSLSFSREGVPWRPKDLGQWEWNVQLGEVYGAEFIDWALANPGKAAPALDDILEKMHGRDDMGHRIGFIQALATGLLKQRGSARVDANPSNTSEKF